MDAFGPRAERWSAMLPPDLPILAVDEIGFRAAYRAAVERRTRAEPFFLWVCIPAPRAAIAMQLSEACAGGRSLDDQRRAFAQVADGGLLINGTRIDELTSNALALAWAPVGELMRLADGLFATSRCEAERVASHYRVTKPHVAIAAAAATSVPAFEHVGGRPSIVVWANGIPVAETALIQHALAEMRLPVFMIANDAEIFARPGSPPQTDIVAVLAGASVIVDASPADPGAALALAERGVPLVVASTSGAHEYIDGVHCYQPWDWKSLYDAVARALAAPPPRRRDLAAGLAETRATIAAASVPPPADGPLVSVVIPTYNRRERLPGALRSIFDQHYRNLEVIVVNDGGADVGDIVAEFPRARLISYEQNGGVEHAINTGYAATTGAYVTHVSDDDAFYPDHIARLVDACERSGCAIAHGNTLVRFLREVDGALELEGFSAGIFAFPLEKTEALYNSPIAGHAFIIRRDVGVNYGWYDETLAVLGDQEMQTRYAAHVDFVHVDRTTNEWRYVGGDTNLSSRKAKLVPDAMRQWFAGHPTARHMVQALRESTIAKVEARPEGFRFQATVEYLDPAASA